MAFSCYALALSLFVVQTSSVLLSELFHILVLRHGGRIFDRRIGVIAWVSKIVFLLGEAASR